MNKIIIDENYIKSLPLTTNRIEVAWLRHVSLVYDCLTFHSTRWK